MPARKRTVALGKLARASNQATLFEREFTADIEEALSPDVQAERYGRVWRLSRPQTFQPGFIAGKLGFQRMRESESVRYDDELKDYVAQVVPSEAVNYSHYVVDLERRYIAFEERPPDIRRYSFLGAMRDILRQSDENVTMEVITDPSRFEEWVKRVRVIEFHAKLRRPNPEYKSDVGLVRDLIEGANADEVTVGARVSDDETGSLRVSSDQPMARRLPGSIIAQAVSYGQNGYSTYEAMGVEGDRVRKFRSRDNVPTTQVAEDASDSSDTIWSKILGALAALVSFAEL